MSKFSSKIMRLFVCVHIYKNIFPCDTDDGFFVRRKCEGGRPPRIDLGSLTIIEHKTRMCYASADNAHDV